MQLTNTTCGLTLGSSGRWAERQYASGSARWLCWNPIHRTGQDDVFELAHSHSARPTRITRAAMGRGGIKKNVGTLHASTDADFWAGVFHGPSQSRAHISRGREMPSFFFHRTFFLPNLNFFARISSPPALLWQQMARCPQMDCRKSSLLSSSRTSRYAFVYCTLRACLGHVVSATLPPRTLLALRVASPHARACLCR